MEVKLTDDGKQIIIILPISRRPSRTGKTTIVASTNGNVPSSVSIDGKPIIIGVNAYVNK